VSERCVVVVVVVVFCTMREREREEEQEERRSERTGIRGILVVGCLNRECSINKEER
jgi:hypothetical protein